MRHRFLSFVTATLIFAALVLVACRTRHSPYEVTVRPLNTGGSPLCIAVNRAVAPSVWLWQAFGRDCSIRGSDIVPMKDVAVSQVAATTRFTFQVPTMLNTVRTIRLTLKGERLGCDNSGAEQPTIARADLNIPDWTAANRRTR